MVTYLRISTCFGDRIEFITNNNYTKITMTKTIQNLISYCTAVLERK